LPMAGGKRKHGRQRCYQLRQLLQRTSRHIASSDDPRGRSRHPAEGRSAGLEDARLDNSSAWRPAFQRGEGRADSRPSSSPPLLHQSAHTPSDPSRPDHDLQHASKSSDRIASSLPLTHHLLIQPACPSPAESAHSPTLQPRHLASTAPLLPARHDRRRFVLAELVRDARRQHVKGVQSSRLPRARLPADHCTSAIWSAAAAARAWRHRRHLRVTTND
jgi:hypothetical protein